MLDFKFPVAAVEHMREHQRIDTGLEVPFWLTDSHTTAARHGIQFSL